MYWRVIVVIRLPVCVRPSSFEWRPYLYRSARHALPGNLHSGSDEAVDKTVEKEWKKPINPEFQCEVFAFVSETVVGTM